MAKKKAQKSAKKSRSTSRAKRSTKRTDSAAPAPSPSPDRSHPIPRRHSSIYSGAAVRHEDGWTNAITSLGTRYDKRRSTSFKHDRIIGDDQLTAIWRANGIGRKVIDVIPDDVTRNWFTVTNDEDDEIKHKLEKLGAQAKVNLAGKLARCYGGGIIIMGINDGGALEDEVNEEAIKSVDWLTHFDRREVVVQTTDIERNITTGRFGEPSFYEVIPRFGVADTTPADVNSRFRVHASRVMRFDGTVLAWREYEQNGYWHDSELEHVYEHIRQLGAVMDSGEFIIDSFVTTVLKVKNLIHMIMTGKDGVLKQRLNWLDMSRQVANTELLDENEELEKHSSTVTGIDTLSDRYMMMISAAGDIPVTKLFGRSPAGQNATGESDSDNYNDKIKAEQRNGYGPKLEVLIRYIAKSKEISVKKPEELAIEWNPLHVMTATEEAELYKKTAEGDEIYIRNQVVDPEAIGQHRFIGDHFNATPPSMTEDEFEEMEEEKEKARQEAAKIQAEMEAKFKQQGGGDIGSGDGDAKGAQKPPTDDDMDQD
jgi:phage-related protein (TIGR01555 family)